MKISEKLEKGNIYKLIAKKYRVTPSYVSYIATGQRNPTKKKGLVVLNELERIAGNFYEEAIQK